MARLGFRKAINEAKDQEGRRRCLLGAMIFLVISVMLAYVLYGFLVLCGIRIYLMEFSIMLVSLYPFLICFDFLCRNLGCYTRVQ